MEVKVYFWILVFGICSGFVSGQVCSPIGQLCTRTTDCCKGCCEAHQCVDRTFACSTDLQPQPGFSSCERYYCPPGHICYLRELCPPENPCALQPNCRPVNTYNSSYTGGYYYRNSAASHVTSIWVYTAVSLLAMSSLVLKEFV